MKQNEMMAQIAVAVKIEDIEPLLSKLLTIPAESVSAVQEEINFLIETLEGQSRPSEVNSLINNIRDNLSYADTMLTNIHSLYQSLQRTLLEEETPAEQVEQTETANDEFDLSATPAIPDLGDEDAD
jgi:vacuolar-type H+-ATPase subunit I/STV1